MIVESGTVEELKRCVFSEVYTHYYHCGHKFIFSLAPAKDEWRDDWWLGYRTKACPFCVGSFINPTVVVLIKKTTMKVYDYSELG